MVKYKIDKWNLDLIRDYNWSFSNSGYLHAWVDGETQLLHRIIAARMGLDPLKLTDHIDRDKENNHGSNLRAITKSQNAMNSKRRSNNTSGYPGVSYNKRLQKWQAKICVDYKQIHLGYFKHKKDAIKARYEAEIKYFGEFANHAHN